MLTRKGYDIGLVLLLVVGIASCLIIVPPLLIPGTDVEIPTYCTLAASHLPQSRMVWLPNGQEGFVILRDHGLSVILHANYGETPVHTDVFVVTASGRVVQEMTFPNDIVASGVSGNLLLVYNDKIGYWFAIPGGALRREDVWIDQYRGRFTIGPNQYVDTSVAFTAIGSNGVLFDHRVALSAVADGCWFPS